MKPPRKVIIIDAKDFRNLSREITDGLFHAHRGGGRLGVEFISRETGEVIDDPDELFGALHSSIERVLEGSEQ